MDESGRCADCGAPRTQGHACEPDRRNSLRKEGLHELPGSFQSPTKARRVDKSEWRPCHRCARAIPVRQEGSPDAYTYVCPFCGHGHVAAPQTFEPFARQTLCHECRTPLQGDQCPQCRFPRGWMRVACPYCGNAQPVSAPHWVDSCDLFTLECVKCESVFESLCIC